MGDAEECRLFEAKVDDVLSAQTGNSCFLSEAEYAVLLDTVVRCMAQTRGMRPSQSQAGETVLLERAAAEDGAGAYSP